MEQTLLKAIQAKCLDCCCNSRTAVRACGIADCPLWAYRDARAAVSASQGTKKRAVPVPTSETLGCLSNRSERGRDTAKKEAARMDGQLRMDEFLDWAV